MATKQNIIDDIKLDLGAIVPGLELEIDDKTIGMVVDKALRELNRYWDETTLVTIPFASCIDLNGSELSLKDKVNTIVKVYRVAADTDIKSGINDPMFMQQWLIFGAGGGTMYSLNDYVLNYAAWSTLSQIRNTLSTDLAFKQDKYNDKLYINNYASVPSEITVEYIPVLKDIEQIKNEYWLDILRRLSLGLTKTVLGRIRTRFTQSSALWTLDGDKMLEEGNSEVKEIRETLAKNDQLIYPID